MKIVKISWKTIGEKTPEMFKQIENKINHGERVTPEEALFMLESNDVAKLGKLANKVRTRLHGKKVFYVVNRHINYSNVCAYDCKFCAFSTIEGEERAYTHSLEDIKNRANDLTPRETELHIVGGCHPKLPFEYYLNMLRMLKTEHPNVHLKAFTAVEIEWFAKKAKKSIREVLEDLKAVGLNSLPGGGAEIFADRVRKVVCRGKADAEEWLDVHRNAHQVGLKSNCTMLYNHIETSEEIVDHMQRLRNLQDETGGFMTFIPLPYHPYNNALGEQKGPGYSTGLRDIQIFSAARVFLDNIPHLKVYWIMLSPKFGQVLLHFGGDDFDGTVVQEEITHAAGADSPEALSISQIHNLIKSAGFEPVERDTIYNELSIPEFTNA